MSFLAASEQKHTGAAFRTGSQRMRFGFDHQRNIDQDMPVPKPDVLLADKGYDGDVIREDLLWRRILPIIPPKTNRREPAARDFRCHRDPNHVERRFN